VRGICPLEADRGAADREQSAPDLEQAEGGGLGGDADVGALEHLGAARDAVPLDGGDDRLARAVVAQHRLPVQVGIGPEAVAVPLPRHAVPGEGLEVHPGAEAAARPREHDGADRVVGVGLGPAVVEADQHRQRERVLRLRPVEREHQCGALAPHGEVFRPSHDPSPL
jgi:hypothetical protein